MVAFLPSAEAQQALWAIRALIPDRPFREHVPMGVPQDAEGMGRGVKQVREEAPARG